MTSQPYTVAQRYVLRHPVAETRPASSPPSDVKPLPKSTAGRLHDAIAAALPEDASDGAWEAALALGLRTAVHMLTHQGQPVNPYDTEKLRYLRMLLDHHDGALRRRKQEQAR